MEVGLDTTTASHENLRLCLSGLDPHDHRSSRALMQYLSKLPSRQPGLLLKYVQAVKELPGTFRPPEAWRRDLCCFALEVSKCLHQIVLDVHLRELRKIAVLQRYWRRCLKIPFAVRYVQFVASGLPTTNVQIQTTVSKLVELERSFVAQVGRLQMCLEEMEKISFVDNDVHSFVHFVESVYKFITEREAAPATEPSQVLTLLEESLFALTDLEDWFEDRLKPLAKPNLLRRHWLSCSVIGGLVLGCGRYLALNQSSLASWADNTRDSLQGFADEHVLNPSKVIYESVFHTFRDRQQDMSTAKQNLDNSRRTLESMLLDYGKGMAAASADPGESQRLAERAKECDMEIVMDRYSKEIQQPLMSSVRGQLLQGIFVQVQKVKLDSEISMVALDQILKANEINFSLMALLPAVLFVGGTLFSINRVLWTVLLRERNRSATYQRAKRAVCLAERIVLSTGQYGFLGSQNPPTPPPHSTNRPAFITSSSSSSSSSSSPSPSPSTTAAAAAAAPTPPTGGASAARAGDEHDDDGGEGGEGGGGGEEAETESEADEDEDDEGDQSRLAREHTEEQTQKASAERERRREQQTGYLLYQLHLLEREIPHLPKRHRGLLRQDIRLLRTLRVDHECRLQVLQGMYRTYGWLPSA